MKGTIVGIQGFGTIITVTIAETWEEVVADTGRLVHFDHTPFRWLCEGRGGLDNVINQPVFVTESGGMTVLSFEDENND